jgi:hypothetical protein
MITAFSWALRDFLALLAWNVLTVDAQYGVLSACMHGKRAYGYYVYARPLHSAGVFDFVDMRPMGLVILSELSICASID